MSRMTQESGYLNKTGNSAPDLSRILYGLHVDLSSAENFMLTMPFSRNDITAGAENELQTAVIGKSDIVDLPITIKNSNYYRNLIKRASSGELSTRHISKIEDFLDENTSGVWDNSWVRFPRSMLTEYANGVLITDLRADKKNPLSPQRNDASRFVYSSGNSEFLRIPVSYLIKLSLADVISRHNTHPVIQITGEQLMAHFLNDNTSPETYSFCPVPIKAKTGNGKALAAETLKRFLLTHLLVEYANNRFGLSAGGQKTAIYFAPNTAVRQQQLNGLVTDSFYRELFMSPCLSGWDNGEAKHDYMNLCHAALSRSRINSLSKLREGGIINRDLVILPNMSNTCLANNGTHISLGSRKLSGLLKDGSQDFGPAEEKYVGDLASKIFEHFLPLFVGTYSAAPQRIDFIDFHPENVLGFLPHELHYTHLRMIWRRWRKKANLKIFGNPITPFGPQSFDRLISSAFKLKGDFIPDLRLIDYLVCPMSTEESPALDGAIGNDIRLKNDLAEMGIIDPKMALYSLYRQRIFAKMGYAGFEGRHYSLFSGMLTDMAEATNMQALITALAYKYVLSGRISHANIPDDPYHESERRQVFFCRAIGIPTFYVKNNTRNILLQKILKKAARTRTSARYPGFTRVHINEYMLALLDVIKTDGADLVEMLSMRDTVNRLELNLRGGEKSSASSILTKGILETCGAKNPMDVSANDFNLAAEEYYRTTLKTRYLQEAFSCLTEQAGRIDKALTYGHPVYADAIAPILQQKSITGFFKDCSLGVLSGSLDEKTLVKLIHILLLLVHNDIKETRDDDRNTSVY